MWSSFSRLLLGALLAGALSTTRQSPAQRQEPTSASSGGDRTASRTNPGGVVQAQMRNVDYRVIAGAVLNIHRLRGELHSKRPGHPPVFDDKDSFLLKIDSAEIGMTEQSMAGLFNEHVFAYPGSPLEKLEIHIEKDRVIQKGVLRKALKIPFSIAGTLALTSDGEIRVHSTSIKVAGISVAGLMRTFGLELERLMNLRQDRGIRIDGNDLLISAERMLPPPQIQGRVIALRQETGRIVLTFGWPGRPPKAPLKPPDRSAPNYMYYEKGVLAFGKLTMRDTELQIVDADPRDPFDFYLDHYNEQLSAGYDENLPDHGLLVHMPDYAKLGKPAAETSKPQIAHILPRSRS